MAIVDSEFVFDRFSEVMISLLNDAVSGRFFEIEKSEFMINVDSCDEFEHVGFGQGDFNIITYSRKDGDIFAYRVMHGKCYSKSKFWEVKI